MGLLALNQSVNLTEQFCFSIFVRVSTVCLQELYLYTQKRSQRHSESCQKLKTWQCAYFGLFFWSSKGKPLGVPCLKYIVVHHAKIFISKHSTPFLKTLTAKWSWCYGCCSSILEFPELYLRTDLKHMVANSRPNTLFRKFKDGRAEATAATVPRPFFCQFFPNRGVLCLEMNILACVPRYISSRYDQRVCQVRGDGSYSFQVAVTIFRG